MNVLVFNSGSSSLKFGIYRVDAAVVDVLHDGEAASSDAIDAVVAASGMTIDAIGHRVVHGGPSLLAHCCIDDDVLERIRAAAPFAPLHTAPALAAIKHARKQYPDTPQVACFDTAFHAGLPDVARVLPIARALRREGLRRYGFHGISCESIVRQLRTDRPARLVIAHLGHGASVTAVRDGQSMDTSMGLTPDGGVVMGTRTGDVDPGLLLYLLREGGVEPGQLESLINEHSGLLGISGISSDMRALHEEAANDAHAELAIGIFCASVRKAIAAMISVLGGADLVVFTGGIGEHDARVREVLTDGLRWAGVGAFRVLPSEENAEIAGHAWRICSG